MSEYALSDPPTDGVTAVRFGPTGDSLAVTSWDAALRLYDVASADVVVRLPQPAPLLDVDFVDAGSVLSGATDGGLRLHGLETGVERVLGWHASGVRCVRFCGAVGAGVSGSWDRSLKLWDVRTAEACVGTYAQPDKVFALCVGAPGVPPPPAPLVVVATAARHVHLLDLRRPSEPLQRRESALKCQTRAVAQMPGGLGYALGSVEGRVAVEYVDPSAEAQARKYAFKCHRTVVDGVGTAFPVNAICYHPRHGTFATGGCDGHVNVWDGANKKRLCQLPRRPTSVAALAFSADGSRLAVAASYTYEMGERERAPDAVYVRTVAEAEVKPKAKRGDS